MYNNSCSYSYFLQATTSNNQYTQHISLINIPQVDLYESKGNILPPDMASIFFTKSNEFSQSHLFEKTPAFSKSALCAKSDEFTKSSLLTKSDIFEMTQKFSKFNIFSKSHPFRNSLDFTYSSKFTQSINFTKSNVLTNSYGFRDLNTLFHIFFTCSSYLFLTYEKMRNTNLISSTRGCFQTRLIQRFIRL